VSAARRVAGVVGLVVLLVGLLTGCNTFVQYYEDVDELGKKIVADWKEQSEVVDASYGYVHGIDSGQQMDLKVIVRAESASDEVVDKLKDIANRDYWQSMAYDREDNMSLQFVAYSSDNPPAEGESDLAKSIGQGDLGVSPKVGLEKYGPRPTKR
jgi:predicted small secreted protein